MVIRDCKNSHFLTSFNPLVRGARSGADLFYFDCFHLDRGDKVAVVPGAFDYPLEPGMVPCVEALVGEQGGDFSIKLEDQVLITEYGHENLISYAFDPALMGAG